MSFRKRNVGLSSSSRTPSSTPQTGGNATTEVPLKPLTTLPPGIRPSSVDGRPTTSTGTSSLDALLARHAGLPLGTSLLIEESGTTDFGGVLLRHYAAEGVVQGHRIHVIGVGEGWCRDLPGLLGPSGEAENESKEKRSERMKIAWRYERLGDFGGIAGSREPPASSRTPSKGSGSSKSPASGTTTIAAPTAFCHAFDLTKRLDIPFPSPFLFYPISHLPTQSPISPFTPVLEALTTHLFGSLPKSIHRVVIPTLLSPALYPAHASEPRHLLQFLHALRGLLRQYPSQLTALITVPLELYPRSTGLLRWAEILSDGVIELAPFPHIMDMPSHSSSMPATASGATPQEDAPQGMVKIHRLPIFHEKGGGGGAASGLGEDLSFTVSRRKFTISPFSLPPVEGDDSAPAQASGSGKGKQTAVDVDF